MKKLSLLFIAISIFACTTNVLDFHTQIIPETKYSEHIVQATNVEIKYTGTDEFLQSLKDKGIANPTTQNSKVEADAIIKTYKIGYNDYFPVTMEYTHSTDTNVSKLFPKGSLIHGRCRVGDMPVFDSITGNGQSVETNQQLLGPMQNIFSQYKFPEKQMRIGESFSKSAPLSMPIAGNTINMNIVTNYTLTGIHGGVATFDITQTYTMNGDAAHSASLGSGDGKGDIIYDIKNNFYRRYNIAINMRVGTKIENDSIIYISKSGYTQTIEISENK